MMNFERIIRVGSLQEAWELNQERGNVVLGGFMWMKMASRSIAGAIDLSGLGLDTIEETAEEFRIGCMCSLRSLEVHAGLEREFSGFIRNVLHHIVGVQFRNGATVGGSLFGRYGFSDVLTALLVLDTEVELYQGGMVTLKDFAAMKPDSDILVRIIIKKDGRKAAYQSQRNTKTDFPIIAAAAAISGSRVFVSVGARPARADLVEREWDRSGEGSALEFAGWAADQFTYGKDMRAGADYRRHLAEVYIRRGLLEIMGEERS